VKGCASLKVIVESQNALTENAGTANQKHSDKATVLKAELEPLWFSAVVVAQFEQIVSEHIPVELDTTVLWQLLAILINSSFIVSRDVKASGFVFGFVHEVSWQLQYLFNIISSSDIPKSEVWSLLMQLLVDITTLSEILLVL
jgi:hypothetical protein